MQKTIVLVSCVSEKRAIASPAQELYISDWFLKAASYARMLSPEWYILSAKYGVVHPNQVLEPYNQTLKTMSKADRMMWAERVFAYFRPRLTLDSTVIFLAGLVYREFLIERFAGSGCKIEVPMEGLRIGEQLRWLNIKLERNA